MPPKALSQKTLFFLSSSVVCLLLGCQGHLNSSSRIAVEESTRTRLEKAAEQIHSDLTELTRKNSQNQSPNITEPPASGLLNKAVTLKWTGPALPAVQSVAQMIGYALDVKGHPSKSQPVIHLNAVNKSALAVLEDIGWQAGPDFGLVVKEDRQTLYVFLGN